MHIHDKTCRHPDGVTMECGYTVQVKGETIHTARAIVKYVCDTIDGDRESIAQTVAKMIDTASQERG